MSVKSLIINIVSIFRGGYIERARKAGVVIGERCRLIGSPSWGSEPWLVTLGNHVEISSNVRFITHDKAMRFSVWKYQGGLREVIMDG